MKFSKAGFVASALLLVTCGVAGKSDPRARLVGSETTVAIKDPPTITTIRQLADLALQLDIKRLLGERRNKPKFLVESGEFTFYPGDVPLLGDEESRAQTPFLIPMARMLQLEDLRAFINQQSNSEPNFWNPYFHVASAILSERSVPALTIPGITKRELRVMLTAYDQAIDEIFKQAAKDFAEAHKLKIRIPTINIPSAHGVPVSFELVESGAHLYVIPATFFTSNGAFDFMWREILADRPTLGGSYFYRVVWADRSVTGPTRFEVDRQGLVIRINK